MTKKIALASTLGLPGLKPQAFIKTTKTSALPTKKISVKQCRRIRQVCEQRNKQGITSCCPA